MRRDRNRLLAVAAMLVGAVTPSLAQPRPDLAAEVTAAERAFARTMADRDLDAFASFVAEEAIFFNGQAAVRGRVAVRADWAKYFAPGPAPFSWEPDEVEVLESGTLAHSSGPVRDPAGRVVGRFNSVWRRDATGVWRVVFDRGCPAP